MAKPVPPMSRIQGRHSEITFDEVVSTTTDILKTDDSKSVIKTPMVYGHKSKKQRATGASSLWRALLEIYPQSANREERWMGNRMEMRRWSTLSFRGVWLGYILIEQEA